ncbi:MAG: hypothetical protein IJ232_09135 [Lachnospiraceae bacterium]|nr:hypothetical protein [Lachnospiraceae bacterium]
MISIIFTCIGLILFGWLLGFLFNNNIITIVCVALAIYVFLIELVEVIVTLKAKRNSNLEDFLLVKNKVNKHLDLYNMDLEYIETNISILNSWIHSFEIELEEENIFPVYSNIIYKCKKIEDIGDKKGKEFLNSMLENRSLEKSIVQEINKKYSILKRHFFNYPEKELYFLCNDYLENNNYKTRDKLGKIAVELSIIFHNYVLIKVSQCHDDYFSKIKDSAAHVDVDVVKRVCDYLYNKYNFNNNLVSIRCGVDNRNIIVYADYSDRTLGDYEKLELLAYGYNKASVEIDDAALSFAILEYLRDNYLNTYGNKYEISVFGEYSIKDERCFDIYRNYTLEEINVPCFLDLILRKK